MGSVLRVPESPEPMKIGDRVHLDPEESLKSEVNHNIPETTEAGDSGPAADPNGYIEPHTHKHTYRKIQEWSLEVRKEALVIGDSNLARIPRFTHAKIQVDSYPGATFHHISSILKKLPPHPQVTHLIISAGINNCLQEQEPTTTWKQLQQLLKTAHITFPKANIHVPIINFSLALPDKKRALITKLNNTIAHKCNFLPEINQLLFSTVPGDPVHWTPETASQILKYWASQLNW